jgi:hypothetical protein
MQPLDEEEEVETVAEKRLKLAKDLIARAEAHGCLIFDFFALTLTERDEQEDAEITTEAISHRLKSDLVNLHNSTVHTLTLAF